MLRQLIYTILVVLIFFDVSIAQNEIEMEASVSRSDLSLKERFTYKLEIRGERQLNLPDVEVSEFNDFYIVGGPSQSTNFSYFNGEISSSATYTWVLEPKKNGSFKIEAATLRYRGMTYKSESISINVSSSRGRKNPITAQGLNQKGGKKKSTFLVASIDKDKVYKGEQVTVTYRIYTRVRLVNFNTPSPPEAIGFWVEEIPQPAKPLVEEEIIDGVRYSTAVVGRFALFPTRSGKLELAELPLDFKERVKRRRSNSIFDDFFDDPFGRFVNKRVLSNSLKINVLPLPEKGKPEDFSGAVGDFKITAEIVESEAEVNDAITLRVKISGAGNIKSTRAPVIEFPDGVEIFEPEINQQSSVKRGRIYGEKNYEYVLILRKAGQMELNRIELTYFNPKKNKYEVSRSKPIIIDVEEGDRSFVAVNPGLTREEVVIISSDIRFIKRETSEFSKRNEKILDTGWLLFWGVSPMFALAGAFLFRRHHDQMSTNVAYQRRRRVSGESRKRLKKAKEALEAGNLKSFHNEVSKVLLGAAADKLNLPFANINVAEIEDVLKKRGADETSIAEFNTLIALCRKAVYSPENIELYNMDTTYDRAVKSLDNLLKVL
ncbi:MAG: protein BatD [Candidatus Marinimicrobia bacterium]|nr:protein BatD [Candidatus Neomarinimicrobiota bacterium]